MTLLDLAFILAAWTATACALGPLVGRFIRAGGGQP